MDALDTHTIQGVVLEAVYLPNPRVPGSHFYRAKVQATGVVLTQDYQSRPKMWKDLEWCAKLVGERFATDTLSAK